MPVVALWSPSDLLLGVLAPIGLALSRRPCLVIDLDPSGPEYDAPYALADLVRDGPTRLQLEPTGRSVAVLANGGVGIDQAADIVAALAKRWPHVVLRCDPAALAPDAAVALMPLLPRPFMLKPKRRVVYQQLGLGVQAPRGSIVLPRPSHATVGALMGLRSPSVRSRWLAKLARLWDLDERR